jgi:hypothetical protein
METLPRPRLNPLAEVVECMIAAPFLLGGQAIHTRAAQYEFTGPKTVK